jgi:hypothetical protein
MLDILKNQTQRETRHDVYGSLHRGLRKAETDLLNRLGSLDGENSEAVQAVIDDLRKIIAIGRFHLIHEDEFISTALEQRMPGGSARLVEDHSAHERSFADMEGMLAAIESLRPAMREPMIKALYLRFSEFIRDDFELMLEEEVIVLPLLQGLFSDEELVDIERQIVESLPSDVMLDFVAITLPAVDSKARLELSLNMRRTMSPETFRTVMRDTVKPVLASEDWKRLEADLQLAS